MCNSSKIRGALITIMFVAGLTGCEDIAPKTTTTTKPRSTAAVDPPKPEPLLPTPVVPPPQEVKIEPKVEVGPPKEPILTEKNDEDLLPSDPLAAARKLLAEGENGKALKSAKLAVGKTPKRSSAWNTLGRVQLQLGQREEALESFGKAIELNPNNSYAHNNAGLVFIYGKQFNEAIEVLEQAVELTPVEGYMWNNLGMAYEQLDRLEEARHAYSKAAAMGSDKAKESLARLEGVQSVMRTAKVDSQITDGKRETTTRQ